MARSIGSGGVTDHDKLTGVSADDHHTKTKNVPAWSEDANSPLNSTGSQSATLTLSGSYDIVVLLIGEFTNTSGGTQDLEVRVNGDAGANYNYREVDGARTTGEAGWPIGSFGDNDGIKGKLRLASGKGGIRADGPLPATDFAGLLVGFNSNVSAPVDSITLRGGSGTVTAKARAFGWNAGI